MTSFSGPQFESQRSKPHVDASVDVPVLQRLILVALQTQNSVSSIALTTDKKKQSVSRALKTLVKKGLVERMGSSYILSGRGHVVIQKWASTPVEYPLDMLTASKNSPSLLSAEEDKLSVPVACHDISFNVLLWSIPEGWSDWMNVCCGLHLPEDHPAYPRELRRAARKFGVNKDFRGWQPVDITLFNGFSFRVHPRGVLVHVPDVVAESPSVAAKKAFMRLVSVLPRIERWLKLDPTQLYKQGRLNIELVSTHHALFEREFVSWWVNVEGRGREEFAVKDADGHLLLFMDQSHPCSIESPDPVKGESAMGWVQEVFGQYAGGQYIPPKEVKARVEALEGGVGRVGVLLSDELAPVLREFSVQMEAHVGTAVGLHEGSVALTSSSVAIERAAAAQERSAIALEKTTAALVEVVDLARVKEGRGGGWLKALVGGVCVVVGVLLGRGWLW